MRVLSSKGFVSVRGKKSLNSIKAVLYLLKKERTPVFKHLLFLGCFCLIAGLALAQPGVEGLLSIERRKTQKNEQLYDGQPIVFIGQTVGASSPQEPGFVPMPSSWRPDIERVLVQTPTKETISVPFVTHVPYFMIKAQFLSDGDALVTETIQFILPKGEKASFDERIYENQIERKDGSFQQIVRQFLEVKHNELALSYSLVEGEKQSILRFIDAMPFEAGVHTYQISYLIKDAVSYDLSRNEIFISFLGKSFPFLIERLVIWLDLPKFTPIASAEVLFGQNNLAVPSLGSFLKDRQGNLVFKMEGILPIHTDVRLDVWTEKGTFQEPLWSDQLLNMLYRHLWLWIMGIGSLLIWLYYRISAAFSKKELQTKEFQNKMALRVVYAPALMRFVLMKKVDNRTVLALILSLANKGYLKIKPVNKDFLFMKEKGNSSLTRSEKALYSFLFAHRRKEVLQSALSFKPFMAARLRPALLKEARAQFFRFVAAYEMMGVLLMSFCLWALYYGGASFVQGNITLVVLGIVFAFGWHYFKKKSVYSAYLVSQYEKYTAYLQGEAVQSLSKTKQEQFYVKKMPYVAALDLKEDAFANKPVWYLQNKSEFSLTEFSKAFLNNLLHQG